MGLGISMLVCLNALALPQTFIIHKSVTMTYNSIYNYQICFERNLNILNPDKDWILKWIKTPSHTLRLSQCWYETCTTYLTLS